MKEIFIDDQYVVISKDDYRMLKEEHALLTKQAAAKASVPENVTLKGEVINPMMIDGVINPMMIDGVRFINRKDAAKILDVGFPTLWRWNNEGLLHAIKVGGRKVYYRYDDVLNLLKGGKLC